MRKIGVFLLSSVLVAAPSGASSIPEAVTVRAVAWDFSWKPEPDQEWNARVVGEVAAAVKDGVDVVVFPEGFSNGRALEGVLSAVKDAAGPDLLVVLGNAPYQEPGWDHALSRAYILSGGGWQTMDKLDPTPSERARLPPAKPGMRLPLFRFRGGVVAALPAFTVEKPEIAASLKKRGVQLVLVSVPANDEAGAARVSRAASARAVELGCAVVVAPPSSVAPALYLPAQQGFDLRPQPPAGRDFRLPWKKLLDLRVQSPGQAEERPCLDPAPYYQVEL